MKKLETLGFKHFCMTVGNLPSSYVESLSYYECLLWLIKYLQEEVIPTVNNNSEAVTELQQMFIELQSYVNTYFDNLDVQEEIDNKLDKMVEDGTLQEIITQYLQSNVSWTFDNVNDMKNATNLINGSYAETIGYYSANDGGASKYYITDTEPSTYYEKLNNDLYAVLITNNEVNIKQFGAVGDGKTDDTEAIKSAIASLKFGNTLNFNHNESYLISETIYLPSGANYIGNKCNFIPSSDFTSGQFMFEYGSSALTPAFNHGFIDYTIKGISLINGNEVDINGFHIKQDVTISDIYSWGLDRTIEVYDTYIDFVKISDVNVRGKRGSNYAIDTGYQGDSRELRRIHFHRQSMISDTPNMLYIGGGHNCCIVESYVNGNINIIGSNVIMKNLHIEIGNIVADSCELKIDGCYIYKMAGIKPIVLTKSNVNIVNGLISYRDEVDYTSDECIDINLDDGTILKVNNVFKVMQGLIVGFKHYAGIVTNKADYNTNMLNNSIDSLTRGNTKTNYLVQSPDFAGNILALMYTDGNNKWKQNNGTYYYRAILLYDKTRMVGFTSGSNVLSATVTLNGNAPFIALNGYLKSDIRLYRGTISGTYTHYVDTSTATNRIIDNGILCNGNKWLDNDSGNVDTVLYAYTYEKINKENVRVYANSLPTVGTWKKGDIIIKSIPVVGSPYGWVCTEAGTPGTWKPITSNIA